MEKCRQCGRLYDDVWVTTDEIWRQVTGIEDGNGLFCMPCFAVMAREKGVSLYWVCGKDVFVGRRHSFCNEYDRES